MKGLKNDTAEALKMQRDSVKNRDGMQRKTAKVVTINMQSIQAVIDKAKNNAATSVREPVVDAMKNKEEKAVLNLSDVVSRPLPVALVDRLHSPSMQGVFKTLLNLDEDTSSIDGLRERVFKSDPKLFCSLTNLIMTDPVMMEPNGQVFEREALIKATKTNKRLMLIDATDRYMLIKHELHNRNILENIQYLPSAWMDKMINACKHGDVAEIRMLYIKNSRFLTTPHPVSRCVPLQYAIQNEQSLTTVVELLDHRRKGLALASLLQPDNLGFLPLENALRYGVSLNCILKLMAWMGARLDSFTLKAQIPLSRQHMLNQLVLVCVLQGNASWAKKVVSWGGDLESVMEHDKTLLQVAVARHANPDVIAELSAFSKQSETTRLPTPREVTSVEVLPAQAEVSPISALKIIVSPPTVLSEPERSTLQDEKKLNTTSLRDSNHLNKDAESYPTLPPSRSRLAQLERESLLQSTSPKVVEKSKPHFFPPLKDMLKLAETFVQAIIDNNQTLVNSMLLKNPGIALISVQTNHLVRLEKVQNMPAITALTGFQCAYIFYPDSRAICKKILEVLPEDHAMLQLGGEREGAKRLAALKSDIQVDKQFSRKMK